MQYKFATQQTDYSDFSSGRVFYSFPGHPAFPVRLASEIFQRCLAHRERLYGVFAPCTLYDPCCGAAYHLSVLGHLHGDRIGQIIASDIDEQAVALAARNLGLLHRSGLDQRIREIEEMIREYQKESHQEALRSASLLQARLLERTHSHEITIQVFSANVADKQKIYEAIPPRSVDIVFADVPYGEHSQWLALEHAQFSNPLEAVLDTVLGVLSPTGIVAIASNKQHRAVHERFQRLEQFQSGKRRVFILKPIYDEEQRTG
jgi:16S rRNA G966 N2-methylase RsmD